ncbi:MAG: nucleoside phosphorylase [Pseudomonadota bacterium]
MTEESVFSDRIRAPGPAWPARGVLAFTKMELKIFRTLLGTGQEKAPILGGMTKIVFFPGLVLAGPMLGAPQAGMVLETLSRRGTKEFFSLGLCGALQPDLTWGDVVVPLTAFSEEGVSACYPLAGPPSPDPGLAGVILDHLRRKNQKFKVGKVWTTDAPFRETREKISRHAADGVLAVDMETSALMTVARFRNLAWAGLMVVSDELWGEKWRPGFQSVELKKGLKTAAEIILEAARS